MEFVDGVVLPARSVKALVEKVYFVTISGLLNVQVVFLCQVHKPFDGFLTGSLSASGTSTMANFTDKNAGKTSKIAKKTRID